jgi:hypothetical protein
METEDSRVHKGLPQAWMLNIKQNLENCFPTGYVKTLTIFIDAYVMFHILATWNTNNIKAYWSVSRYLTPLSHETLSERASEQIVLLVFQTSTNDNNASRSHLNPAAKKTSFTTAVYLETYIMI